MILHAVLIVLLGLLCLVGAVVSIIFTVLGFANNKNGKYAWLTGFLVCLAGMILCIFMFVRKAVNKVESFTENLNSHMKNSFQSYSDSLSYDNQIDLQSNEQIRLLKSYYPDSTSVPDQFYYYLGFDTYYRYPLRYPYSIHCNLFKENGDLFNESKVTLFDQNDNGEIQTSVNQIDKLAFDKNYLLIDRKFISTRSGSSDEIHHYLLFSFNTGESKEALTEKELFKLAKQNGYRGPDKLISIQEYSELFSTEKTYGEEK